MSSRASQKPQRSASLYLVAASSHVAKARVKRSVLEGRDPASVAEATDDGDASFISRVTPSDGKFRVWAVRDSPRLIPTWSRMTEGDWVLFFARGYLFGAGHVSATHASRSLGVVLWGKENGADFSHLIAFDQVIPLAVRVSAFRDVLGTQVLGFRQVNADSRGAIVRRFGSIDAFVEQELQGWQETRA
jgi:hypothetical protein